MTTPQQNKEVMENQSIKINTEVSVEIIKDLLSMVYSSGAIAYWSSDYSVLTPDGSDDECDFMPSIWTLYITDAGDNYFEGYATEPKPYIVNKEKLLKGLEVVSSRFPESMRNIMTEDYDRNDADILIQCAIFGTTIYG